jgi:hypothetical protein
MRGGSKEEMEVYVEDESVLKPGVEELQPEQFCSTTHKSDDPVSMVTVKDWGLDSVM